MISRKFIYDLKTAAGAAWYFLSALVLVLILITLLFPDMLMKIAPVCISKSLYGEECFMCGSTRAFVEISKGNFFNAYLLNKFSIILFSMFILNTMIFLTFIVKKFI